MSDYNPDKLLKNLQDKLVGAIKPLNESSIDQLSIKCVHIGYPIAIQTGMLALTILLFITILVYKHQQKSID